MKPGAVLASALTCAAMAASCSAVKPGSSCRISIAMRCAPLQRCLFSDASPLHPSYYTAERPTCADQRVDGASSPVARAETGGMALYSHAKGGEEPQRRGHPQPQDDREEQAAHHRQRP